MAAIPDRNFAVRAYLRRRGPERVIIDRQNPLEKYSAIGVKQRYRFDVDTIYGFCEILSDRLQRPTARGNAIPVPLQVCVFLRFLACGSFQLMVGDGEDLSKSSVCRIVRACLEEVHQSLNDVVFFPEGDRLRETKKKFFAIAGFPNVVGALDCTQVKIQAPHEFEEVYVCRKSMHSINVQMVCDADRVATNLVAKWPGSVHDSRIFRLSALGRKLAGQAQHDGFLLGDKGYALQPYLMTPYRNPTPATQRFNNAQARTRTRVEQAFGILKRRFHCLHTEIRLAPEQACKVIVCCVILNNIALKKNDVVEPLLEQQYNLDPIDDDTVTGNVVRNNLSATYFA